METFLIKALQLILSLSILVIVHEFGHYIFARIFKIRVEKFYLFFDPWFALFRFKPKRSETEYGIGWLPLGGYVKISGMIDESMDKEQMKQPAEPWEFRSKPAWQRLLVMVAGVFFNLMLAFFIYAMVIFTWNDTYLPLKNVTRGMEFSNAAQQAGFKNGDILLRADDKELQRFGMSTLLSVADAKEVTVLREGQETKIDIPNDFMKSLMATKEGFASYRVPVVIGGVEEGYPAAKTGMRAGDSIVSVNGVPTATMESLKKVLTENRNTNVPITFYRNGELITRYIGVVGRGDFGVVGFENKPLGYFYTFQTDKYSFFASFPAGVKMGVQTLKDYINQFKYVFTKEGASSLGGFGSIGNLFPPVWDWHSFWMMTAFLSVILAFMNILPIPALDGGHVMFLLYEVISGRKPNEKFMEYAQIGGMVLLFALLLYANGMDIFRAIFK